MINKRIEASFGALVRELRERRGISQLQLDRAMGRKPSWTAHMEAGKIPPPDREGCGRLAEALSVDGEDLWRSAAHARLAHADDQALATVLAEQAEHEEVARELDPDERRLVLALRRFDEATGRGRARSASSLVRLLNLVLVDAPDGHPVDAARLARSLDAIDEGTHRAARAMLTVAASLGEILDAERERLGVGATRE